MDKQELLALAEQHDKTGEWEWSQGNYEGAKQHYAKAESLRQQADIHSTVVTTFQLTV